MRKRTMEYLSGRSGEGALLEEGEGSTSSKHDEDSLGGDGEEKKRSRREKEEEEGRKALACKAGKAGPLCTSAVPSSADACMCTCVYPYRGFIELN
jgi:hypothetical protein